MEVSWRQCFHVTIYGSLTTIGCSLVVFSADLSPSIRSLVRARAVCTLSVSVCFDYDKKMFTEQHITARAQLLLTIANPAHSSVVTDYSSCQRCVKFSWFFDFLVPALFRLPEEKTLSFAVVLF